MVTNPEEEEVVDERAELVRTVIGGHPQAGIRRILLYLLSAASMVVVTSAPPGLGEALGLLLFVVGFTLLLATDQLL